MLTFRFNGADGEMVTSQTLTTGAVGQKIGFVFSEEWRDLRKTAVFCAGEVCRIVDNIDQETTIPAEVLMEPMEKLYVGIYGANKEGTIVIPTVMVMGPEIRSGADPELDPALVPEHPVWKQVQNDIAQCGEKISELQDEVKSLWGEGDWELLKNKPFDCTEFHSFGSFPTVGEMDFQLFTFSCYKVSDLTPTADELLRTQFVITQQDSTATYIPAADEIMSENPDVTLFQFSSTPNQWFLVVRRSGTIEVAYKGLVLTTTVTEPGIYCAISLEDSWIPLDIGISFTRIKQIDPIFIPKDNEGLLPSVSEGDNGKILQIAEGAWTVSQLPNYITTVNGIAPDAHGNVEVEIPEVKKELPEPTAGDNGKFVAVVNGAYALTNPPAGGSGASSKVIFEETQLGGFVQHPQYGIYVIAMSPPPFALTVGEVYTVFWDDETYTCEALDVSQILPGAVALGNGTGFNMGGNAEAPFIIVQDSQGALFSALVDYEESHTVAIYMDDPVATQSYVRTYVEQYISEALGGDY